MSEFEVSTRMQRHDLHKFHGLGNDFLVWFRPSVPDDAASVAQRWCDRRTGIGADGLIIAMDSRATTQFVLFNADGSRAEVSGNGLRCFAHAIARHRGYDELALVVSTDAGDRAVAIIRALSEVASAEAVMGTAAPGPAIPDGVLPETMVAVSVETVDIGNPHIVVEVDDADAWDMAEVGPAIERHFMPTGINVHLMSRTHDGIRLNIWERGAGATEACGSGACAAAAIAARGTEGEVDVIVDMPGGRVIVTVGEQLRLRGPSAYIAAIAPLEGT